ncbi:MAG: hypothetical protein IKH72_07345 [Firmicutes bacterium]|nr:hypothetical protein [Bacillota bacterium]
MSILVKVESEIKDELRILNQYESVEEPNSVLICRKVKGKLPMAGCLIPYVREHSQKLLTTGDGSSPTVAAIKGLLLFIP